MKALHLVEVGCVDKASLDRMLVPDGRLDIIEANPHHLEQIRKVYEGTNNVTIHPFAIWKEDTTVNFHIEGHSSYINGLSSPCLVNDNIMPDRNFTIEVEARTFDNFDDGTIDVIDIDIEGAEWYVINNMQSRPKAIFVEMEWDRYRNPFYKEIQKWMKDNYYYRADVCGASHCYMRLI